jgi:hypothetical protein
VRSITGDLEHFFVIVIGYQRFVRIELLERLDGLDRVGIDDAIPDEVLALFGGSCLTQSCTAMNSATLATWT